jgi:hypothetical protein
MIESKFSVFAICKDYLEGGNERILENNKELINGISAKLIRDENGCYNLKDKEFSIKCIFEENYLKQFSSANNNYQLEKNLLDGNLYS